MEQGKVKDVLELIKKREEEVQSELLNAEEDAKRRLQKKLEELKLQLENEKELFEKGLDQSLKERLAEIDLKKRKLSEEHQNQLQVYKRKLFENVEKAVKFVLKSFVKE
ncbi:hypothetical protein [Pseudothermotoga sp.]|uniref:hypothetical protein n=1 Tax=Pseudothermotoga sp. TaxID=2033661 RepID=UPI0031F6FF9D